ncbi:MAG TPA: AI-2E family transporter [Gaiellaceae bacterium]|nr:AI-2E family transporter [Gaiellaceae bacterium]
MATDELGGALDAAELGELSTAFAPPRWLRDLGRASWALVGFVLFLVGIVWVLGETATIVVPVIAGLVVATVATPLVSLLERWRVPRVAGALLVLLALVAVGVVILLLVLGGIVAQSDSISTHVTAALEKVESWLKSAGVDASGAESATSNVSQAVPEIISTLTSGIANGISGITSLAFGLSFAAFAVFFFLKDGPALRSTIERHLGVPPPVAQVITGRVISAVRRYFTGVTIVAAFNAVVVGVGAVLLGVPLAGTIAVVTLVTAYVPFVGAVVSGAFAVLIALGAEGTSTALIMLVIVLLANGMLQNVVQPIAFGATLNLNPLLILVVTIGAGSLFGMVGLVLAAPLTSAAVRIAGDLARMRNASKAPAAATEETAPLQPGGSATGPATAPA